MRALECHHRALEAGFAQQQTAVRHALRLPLALEAGPPGKGRRRQSSVFAHFSHAEHWVALIPGDQVPGIGLELMLDGVDHPYGAIDIHGLFAAKKATQEIVEPGKMVHVPVRHENVADAQQLARGQRAEVAEVQ